MEYKQYDIVLVNLNPTQGSEIAKTRPCVIISPDEMNDNLRTIIIAPFTHSDKKYPTRVRVQQETVQGWVAIDQIQTIDKLRIVENLGNLNFSQVKQIKQVIRETFVD
ncbi:type II toxin-antitoxin system PemK/MazF family toxin [Sandaracinomonas limnophila]|uniref:mRNA interferase n=1 Tax=Sandaracinomonas limnophila TaxID=1862386 RepID=A0A437PS79_9BACT|nr:type II toxin-antitoxin system PemK/MazF family toxin [Sandaracinomonas limnophila]RVU25080.1 type II toxin-antitoxin system PemK/MazF family toxin [Sandaracinomonas limnophila]